jgi:molybdopterin converting factor subunit 1
MSSKKVNLLYFSVLKEQIQKREESLDIDVETAEDVYEFISDKYDLDLMIDSLRVAINEDFRDWNHPIETGDEVVFIPPVSGG